jgi:hypothetical protein
MSFDVGPIVSAVHVRALVHAVAGTHAVAVFLLLLALLLPASLHHDVVT